MIRSARAWGVVASLATLPVLLTGCAGAGGGTATAPRAAEMSMHAAPAAAPPESATMVCGEEITSKVKQVLALPSPPRTTSTWVDSLYTCTYALPMGPMTLTVHVLPNHGEAGAQLDAGRARTAGAETLLGLGERAWGTPAGTAVVLKDNQILTVDTTALPEVFGANDQKRDDLAYEIASDVLGCWTGDGDE